MRAPSGRVQVQLPPPPDVLKNRILMKMLDAKKQQQSEKSPREKIRVRKGRTVLIIDQIEVHTNDVH